MKKRILPFGVIAVIIGLFFISILSSFTKKEISPSQQDSGSDISNTFAYLAKIRNNQVTGEINILDVLRAREQMYALEENSNRQQELDWILLGPTNIGGRVRAILYDNRDEAAKIAYAASVSGGIYKTLNNGQTWNKINGLSNSLNVSCMAQDQNGNIYAGTGEGFSTEEFSGLYEFGYNGGFVGTGLYKSADGENFTRIVGPSTANNDTAAWAFINEIAIGENNRLFVSTNKGLRYSDNGNDWNFVQTTEGEVLSGNSYDVDISPDGTIITDINSLCYISLTGDPDSFILHSGDSNNLPDSDVGRIEFAISPSNPDIMYASICKESGALLNIYRSDDRGIDWYIIAPGGTASLNIFGIGNEIGTGQGFYDNVIEVFPDNPDRVIVGGVNMWEGRKITEEGYYQWYQRSAPSIPLIEFHLPQAHHVYTFRPGYTDQCMIGTDGGISIGYLNNESFSFVESVRNFVSTQFYTIGSSGQKFYVLGGSQGHGIVEIRGYGNPLTAKYGTRITGGNGAFCAVSKIDATVNILSTSGGGNFQRTEDGVPSLNFVPGAVNNNIPDDSFITTSYLWESFSDENSRDSVWFYSRANSYSAGDQVVVYSHNRDFPFYYTLEEALPANDSVYVKDIVSTKFFIATDDHIYMTKEAIDFTVQNPRFFEISNRVKSGYDGKAQSIALSSDANYLFVGTQEGRLYRISNIALAYDYDRADVNSPFCIIATTEIPVNVPGSDEQIDQAITSISVDPRDASHVIITLGNYGNGHYVFRSTNALAEVPTFTSVQGNLPQMPVYSSLIEMKNSNFVLLGTEQGLFATDNISAGNVSWYKPNDPDGDVIGNTPVFMVQQQTIAQPDIIVALWDGQDTTYILYPGTYNYGVIYGATYGRGLYYCDNYQQPVGILDPIPVASNVERLTVYPNPVNNYATLEYKLTEAANVELHVFDLSGRLIKYEVMNNQSAGNFKYILNCSDLPSGTYIVHLLSGKNRAISKVIVSK